MVNGLLRVCCVSLVLVLYAWGTSLRADFTHNFSGESFGLEFQAVSGSSAYFDCGFSGGGGNPNDGGNPCSENKIWGYEDSAGADLKPHPGYCDRPGGVPTCGGTGTDNTPYIVEVIDTGGDKYWHQILGDPTTGWAQEVYYKNSGSGSSQGGIQSPSGGKGGGNMKGNNATRPLHLDHNISGNGTGDPTSIAIRMYLNKDGVELDFFKSEFDKKPMISQTVTIPDVLKTEFQIDMRNLNYSTANVAAQSFTLRQYNMITADPATGIPGGTYAMNPYTAQLTIEPESGKAAYLLDPTFLPPPPPPGQTPPESGKETNVTGGQYTWNGQADNSSDYTYTDGDWDHYESPLKWWNGSSTWSQGDVYPCNPAVDPDFCEQ